MYIQFEILNYSYDNLISFIVWNRDGNLERVKHCYVEIESKSETKHMLYRSDIIPDNQSGNVYRVDGPLIDDVPSSYFIDWATGTGPNNNHGNNFTTTQILNYDDIQVYRLKLKILMLRQQKGQSNRFSENTEDLSSNSVNIKNVYAGKYSILNLVNDYKLLNNTWEFEYNTYLESDWYDSTIDFTIFPKTDKSIQFRQSTSLHLTSTSISSNQDVRDFTSYEFIGGNNVNDFNGITKDARTNFPTYANGSGISFWYSVGYYGDRGTNFDNWSTNYLLTGFTNNDCHVVELWAYVTQPYIPPPEPEPEPVPEPEPGTRTRTST